MSSKSPTGSEPPSCRHATHCIFVFVCRLFRVSHDDDDYDDDKDDGYTSMTVADSELKHVTL
jgi:hypothetical protein